MTQEWGDRQPARPDRYLDWEVLNLSGDDASKERWCSVVVQVTLGPVGNPAANLVRLRDEIDDQPPDGPFIIKMHAEELALLDLQIDAVGAGRYQASEPDDVGYQFFIYLPEGRAYVNGHYAHTDYYRVRLIGQPIVGLIFNEISNRAEQPSIAEIVPPPSQRVAVGVIDDGIAFANARFRTCLGAGGGIERTRFSHIWVQDLEESDRDHRVAFGSRLEKEEIDELFRQSAGLTGVINDTDVYRRAGLFDFSKDSYHGVARRVSHGTLVMDLACGFDPSDPEGDDRPILAVQLPDAATADTSGVTMGSYVLQGLRQIMLWADSLDHGMPMPLVVNFSYGFLAGPKDGTHYLEREIDRLVAHRNRTTPTAVVLPAGNAYRSRTTAKMTLPAGSSEQIEWVALPDDLTPNFLEIWFDQVTSTSDVSPIHVSIRPPIGPAGPTRMPRSGACRLLTEFRKPIAGVYYDATSPELGSKRSRIFVALNPSRSETADQATVSSGCWRLTITNSGSTELKLELFIQRDDTPSGFRRKGRQSYFDHPNARERDPVTGRYDQLGGPGRECPITHEATLSAIGNGRCTVLVGAAEDSDQIRPPDYQIIPADYTSSGPTAARAGPDFSAIAGEGQAFPGVLAAGCASGTIVAMQGTSVAAPQVTRRLADAVASTVRLKQEIGAGDTPDPQLGFGVVPRTANKDVPKRKRS
jgi:hypothetical protein